MNLNGLRWPHFASFWINGLNWPRMASINIECPQMSSNVFKWPQMASFEIQNCMKMYVFDIITMFTWVQNNEVFEHANLQKIFCNKKVMVKRIWISWFYNSFPQLSKASACHNPILERWLQYEPQSFRRHHSGPKNIHIFWSEHQNDKQFTMGKKSKSYPKSNMFKIT